MLRLVWAMLLVVGSIFAPATASAQNYETLFRDFRATGLTQADKRFLQTALAFEGHYIGLLDGDWGPLSQRALNSYARKEFGTSAEDWHMALLAFNFFDRYERDGWGVRHFDVLGLSFLYPYRAVINEPATENFVNWRHANSTLSYSTGIHTRDTTQRLHDYTVDTHESAAELYTLRRKDFAITSATQRDGGVLYTRSNYVNGAWSTIMISADRRHVPILNAVAASISVGYAPPISVSPNGKLENTIKTTVALLREEPQDKPASREQSPTPQASAPTKTNGTGFAVSLDGHFLTNAHVVDGCSTLKIDSYPATIIAQSDDLDLALLQSNDRPIEAVASFSPSPARLNSDVTVTGYPLAGILGGLNVTRGAVSSQMGLGGEVTGMQITAPVQPGNSGGPVLAADGEVVGVVVSKLNAQYMADTTGDIPQNVNFAIRGEIAKLFLFQHGVEPVLGLDDETVSPVDLAEMAAGFTAFIECN